MASAAKKKSVKIDESAEYTVTDAAPLIGLSYGALRYKARNGKIRARKYGDGISCPYLIPGSEVARLRGLYGTIASAGTGRESSN